MRICCASVMKILYRDINVVGKARWCRGFTGTYFVCGMLGYDRDDKYIYYMSQNQCTCMNPLTTTRIHNQCMNPLTTAMIHNQGVNSLTSCCGTYTN